jgi:hypothetical protein
MKKISYLLIGLFFSTLLLGCNPDDRVGAERVIEKSRGSQPRWVTVRPERRGDYMVFIGEDVAANTAGVRDAYQAALSKISYYVNTQVKAVYKKLGNSVDVETANDLKESFIQNVSQSAFSGAKEREVYWEKLEKVTSEGVAYYYRVYSLVEVPVRVLTRSAETAITLQINDAKEAKKAKIYEELKKIETEVKDIFSK